MDKAELKSAICRAIDHKREEIIGVGEAIMDNGGSSLLSI